MDGPVTPTRRRLPNRRPAETVAIEVDGLSFVASVGFDPDGRPAEIFLSGAKDGSGLAAIIEDASVVISIALQHGISASALAKSVARVPHVLDGPPVRAASVIGAALDLVATYEAAGRQL
jgi:hypothetical protein